MVLRAALWRGWGREQISSCAWEGRLTERRKIKNLTLIEDFLHEEYDSSVKDATYKIGTDCGGPAALPLDGASMIWWQSTASKRAGGHSLW